MTVIRRERLVSLTYDRVSGAISRGSPEHVSSKPGLRDAPFSCSRDLVGLLYILWDFQRLPKSREEIRHCQ